MRLTGCKGTGSGFPRSVVLVGSLLPDTQPLAGTQTRGKYHHRHAVREGGKLAVGCGAVFFLKSLPYRNPPSNDCLQRRMKLSTGVISYSHGNNNSWFLIFCELSALGLCLVGGGCSGGLGGIFLMNICFSTSQRLKKICKEWQRRFSIKTLAHLHGLLYIDSYIYGCN